MVPPRDEPLAREESMCPIGAGRRGTGPRPALPQPPPDSPNGPITRVERYGPRDVVEPRAGQFGRIRLDQNVM